MSVEIELEVIEWVTASVENPPASLAAGSSLIASGLLDSLQLLSLIEFVEDKYGIRLDEADMHPVNFETIGAIASLVGRKAGQI